MDPNKALTLVVHPDPDIGMGQIGHLQSWYGPQIECAVLQVPSVTSASSAASLISSLYLFPNLTNLELSFDRHDFAISQGILCSIAELRGLRCCHLAGGSFSLTSNLNLEVLSCLRKLEDLSLRPRPEGGLGDSHLEGLSNLSTLVRSLSFRGSEDSMTNEGLMHLSALRGLTRLVATPLGIEVTKGGISRLITALPSLKALDVGLNHVGQVNAVRDFGAIPEVSIVVNDPMASPSEWSGLVTSCTLCLSTSLVSLRLGLLKMDDSAFMIALGTLTCLTELKLAVSLSSRIATAPFTCDMTVLSSLQRLITLELSCTAHVAQPLTPKSISLLALSWPCLSSLSLTVMKRPEFIPESLELLDLFTSLKTLNLFCPLDTDTDTITDDDDDVGDGESQGYRCLTPINLRHLPPGLTHLRVEQALLHDQHGTPPSLTSKSLSAILSPPNVPPEISSVTSADPPQATSLVDGTLIPHGSLLPSPSTHHRLPSLLTLEADTCQMDDESLLALLRASPGLRHLELNNVDGVSGPGLLGALSGLTDLQHLVLCGVDPEPRPLADPGSLGTRRKSLGQQSQSEGGGGWLGFLGATLGIVRSGSTGGGAAVAKPSAAASLYLHRRGLKSSPWSAPRQPLGHCLAGLPRALAASTGSLKHLEWMPGPEPLRIEELMLLAPRALGHLSHLRFLFLDVESDGGMRAGGLDDRPASGRAGGISGRGGGLSGGGGGCRTSSAGGGSTSIYNDDGEGLLNGSAGWRKELQAVLPRCTVTCNATFCLSEYDIFDDIMIHASGAVKCSEVMAWHNHCFFC